MKIRIIIASVIFASLTALMLSQVNFVAAQTATGGGPGPTSPITAPLLYAIRGKIIYRLVGWYRPAPKAYVEAINTATKEKTTAEADSKGEYSFKLPAGNYKLRAFDQRDTYFLPLTKTISLPPSASEVNFIGVVKVW